MEIDGVHGDKKKGKHESSPKFEGVVTVESGDTIRRTVDARTLFPKWMKESVRLPDSSASSSTTRVTPPPGLSSVGTAQSTTGSIYTQSTR